jgi:ribosome biogenesis GTPase
MTLKQWGADASLQITLGDGEILARVTEEQKTNYRVIAEEGELRAQLAGKLLHPSITRMERPVVGDWVIARPLWNEGKAVIHRVLPRKSLLHRKAAGETEAIQPLAANVDLVFILTSLNRDFNEKRLDRYLTIAHESGAQPVVVLTKSDLEPESAARAAEIANKHKVQCLAISVLDGKGLHAVKALLLPGETSVFVGSSGVGKSTLVNALLEREEQDVAAVRADDDRGRHTTTSRKILQLENGALVIDTPGLREIQLSSEHAEGIAGSFAEIEELGRACRFSDCSHDSEPGCAVKVALESGTIPRESYESFLKLQKEAAFQHRKNDKAAAAAEKKKWKSISKSAKDFSKRKRGE